MTTRAFNLDSVNAVADWIEPLARMGYAARGVIYVLVGGLALLSALGTGGATQDAKGALESLMNSPGGWVVLLLVGVGLIGYALWRFVQATHDTERKGTGAKGTFIRGGMLISAIAHTTLAIWAIGRAIGYARAGSEQGEGEKNWTAWLLGQPMGRYLVAAVGVALVCVAIGQFVKGYKAKFKDHYDTSAELLRKLTPVCRFGLMARGVVFGLIASFFLYAAWTYDADKAGGIAQAFDAIRRVAYGQILLGVTALGMIAFAVYSFIESYYRRIDTRP